MENNYYVYEWIRLDTNEPFYVGKGKNKRCYKLTRGDNHHFNNIVKNIPVAVNILEDNLDEKSAFGLEIYYIWKYRDIIGYDLVNITDGGEGCTVLGEKHSLESKKKIGKGISESWNNKSNEDRKIHKSKISKSLIGKKHSIEHNINVKNNHADFNGKNNPRAKSVICLTTKRIFYTAKDGAKFYNIKNETHISSCCKNKRKSCGKCNGEKLIWKYLIWEHNKKYKII